MSNLKSKNKISIVFILLIAMLLSLSVTATVYFANAEVSVDVTQEQIVREYAFGDVVSFPSCTFTKGGESAVAKPVLKYPDGTQSTQEQATLNQSGKYAVNYVATVGGKVYTKEFSFDVYGKLASFASDKTQVSYGLCDHLGANSYGLNVRIANGDSLTFNHVFDMTSLTLTDKLVEGFVVPDVSGQLDFSKMVFTFTDVENPSVQLVFHGNFHNDSRAYGLTWFTAAGNGQVHCGLEHIGKLWVGENQGCMVPHSFMAIDTGVFWGHRAPTPVAPDDKRFYISYDHELNQAWAGGKIVSDLDDSNYYDKLWFGFPSGKAKLTVSALNYSSATANMCLTSVLGVDLSAENFVDGEAPVVTVNTEYDVMPTAVIGKNYPIPTAKAFDAICGVTDVKVSVWQNYGDESGRMVNVENGRFKVSDVGVYAIVYESTDFSGNVGREVLWVRAVRQLPVKLSVSLDANYLTQIEVGKVIDLPTPAVVGGSGKYEISYEITKGDLTCEIVDGKFVLEEAGEWKLDCIVTDYVGNGDIKSLTLTATCSNKPIANDIPKMPTAFIANNEYELPVLYALDYSSGQRQEKLCQVAVTMNGKTTNYNAGDTFKPVVENSGDKIQIKYTCDGVDLYPDPIEVPVIVVFDKERDEETGRESTVIKTERYFYTTDDLTLTNGYETANEDGLKITANSQLERANLSFINPQIANYFSVDFFTLPNLSKFTQIDVILKDSIDGTTVKASFIKDDGQTVLSVGSSEIILLLDFDSTSSSFYSIGYKDGSFIINGTTAVSIDKTADGKPFKGFASGKIYFEIEMLNASEGASIFIQKVCGINVSSGTDRTGPYLEYVNVSEKNAFIGEIYTISKVIVGDVLAPNSFAYLTVKNPDGSICQSVDGILLERVDARRDYQIKMDFYGDYKVSVLVGETESWKKNPNEFPDTYTVTVIDGEKPVVTFEKDFPTSVKVGDRLVIPNFTVTDNFSTAEEITVLIMVINPKGMPVYLYGDTNAVKCEYAGEYKIYLYVYDQMGNLTMVEKSVTAR
ncbi:MAG: hypothetical protein IJY84_06215 [Clostridia bacterium]|nr:hypothetical protein [Clostridia bacterium]